MDEDSSTPLFTVGHEIANFLVSCGILLKAWEESRLASNSEFFSVKEHEGVAYVAFPSFHKIEDFIVERSKYGEGNIQTNNKVFSDLLKGNDDQPALVHQGALKLFLRIMEETDFKTKLQIYTDSKQWKLKPVIFVGHSLGGAVATLATLWVLEKRLRRSSPFCITFGCRLVGDERFVEAVCRENWGGNFLHVVSQHDIVPRMLLAPLESIAEPLATILPYWRGKVTDSSVQDVCKTLLKNVLQYTDSLANCGLDSLGGSDGVIERSPYKPFGTYMFCSSHGATCIDNSETVLKMLHLTMQSHEMFSDNSTQDCFSEHVEYGSVLKHVIENSVSGSRSKFDTEFSLEMGISLQLEAIGVGAKNDHAQHALRRAAETENKYSRNVDRLEATLQLVYSKYSMVEIEWYKDRCENKGGIGYYDTDIDVNSIRKRLALFWDEIIEMWERNELPRDFQDQNKWINAGTSYRRLLEPLDIADYYLNSMGQGNYLSDGRPNRHKVLQKWMEAKEKTRSSKGRRSRTKRATLTLDSCFWAHVEEALKDLEMLKQGQQQSLQNLEKFQEDVTKMENALDISIDVFFEGSSFMKWWKKWKQYKQNQSPEWSSSLYQKMESIRSCISSTGDVKENIDSAEVQEKFPLAEEVKESDFARSMFQLEWYKMISHEEEGDGYYDSFKNMKNGQKRYKEVNRYRVILADFWDNIIKEWSNHELPTEFQSKWMNAGTAYRKLVEPLDIAHHYRSDKGSKKYLDGRPNRHKVLQGWLEDREKSRSSSVQKARAKLPFVTRDSCFWANVEEALKDVKPGLHQKKESLETFDDYLIMRGNELYSDLRQYRDLRQYQNRRKKRHETSEDNVRMFFNHDISSDVKQGLHQKKERLEKFEDVKQGLHQKKERLEKFEDYVTRMINDDDISSDVFLERSSFMMWWQEYKQKQMQIQPSEWKLRSPLYALMKNAFWK